VIAMLKNTMHKIQRNLLFVFFIFMIGNIVGSGITAFSITEDCAVMSKFRVGRIAYACQRLAP
jgi:hypothetical protein